MIPHKNVVVLVAAFVSIMLLIVARHHPPSRRKIKEIWHGRVFWEGESNTTMLRSSPEKILEQVEPKEVNETPTNLDELTVTPPKIVVTESTNQDDTSEVAQPVKNPTPNIKNTDTPSQSDSKNIILTSVYSYRKDPQRGRKIDCEFDYIANFYNSVSFYEMRAVIMHDCYSEQFVKQYETDKIAFVRVNSPDKSISTNDFRFKRYNSYLKENRHSYYMFVDASDVFFNGNPFNYMKNHEHGHTLFMSPDIGNFHKNAWQVKKCYKKAGELWDQNVKMHNAGVWGGDHETSQCILDCVVNQFETTLKGINNCNMPALNWCVHFGGCTVSPANIDNLDVTPSKVDNPTVAIVSAPPVQKTLFSHNWPTPPLKRIESLAYCKFNPKICAKAIRSRKIIGQRRPYTSTWRGDIVKVLAFPAPWMKASKSASELKKICPVPCAYAKSVDDADATFSMFSGNPVKRNDLIKATSSFESCDYGCVDIEGITLSFSRYSDVLYEFDGINAIDWGARPIPPRPSKPSSVVFISNCVEWRMNYMKALSSNGVNIQFAGTCATTKRIPNCKRNQAFRKCKIDALSKHPFAITFENTILDDYVTEKWSHMWKSGAIPVYMGSPAIYEKKADYPPFINALDFETPASLARYMQEVLRNDTLWEYYTQRNNIKRPLKMTVGRKFSNNNLNVMVCDVCRVIWNVTNMKIVVDESTHENTVEDKPDFVNPFRKECRHPHLVVHNKCKDTEGKVCLVLQGDKLVLQDRKGCKPLKNVVSVDRDVVTVDTKKDKHSNDQQ